MVKTGLFLIFFRLLFTVLSASLVYMQPLFVFVTCGSLLVGTFGALKQIRIKRFIAYASISQVGFIFIGLSCGSLDGLISSILYLFLYVLMSILFFSLLLKTESIIYGKNMTYFTDFYSVENVDQKEIKFLLIVLMSMSGVPPLGGFVGKILLYFAAFDTRLD